MFYDLNAKVILESNDVGLYENKSHLNQEIAGALMGALMRALHNTYSTNKKL